MSRSFDRNFVGQRVKQARLIAGWTQAQLAAQLATSDAAVESGLDTWNPTRDKVEQIENGHSEVTDRELRVLAIVRGVDVRWLLDLPGGVSPRGLESRRHKDS